MAKVCELDRVLGLTASSVCTFFATVLSFSCMVSFTGATKERRDSSSSLSHLCHDTDEAASCASCINCQQIESVSPQQLLVTWRILQHSNYPVEEKACMACGRMVGWLAC